MTANKKRDPRLPKAGTVIVREWNGKTYKVTVLGDGTFRYAGQVHKSISGVARAITGREIISGFDWFGLNKPTAKPTPKPTPKPKKARRKSR